MSTRDRLRLLLLFTPAVTVPLALLGILSTLAVPLAVLLPFGWLVYPVGIVAALAVGVRLRSRYRLAILDSSPLGVLTWLRRIR